ncbi:MAG TPA: insulinase family protein [Sphingopyxis sp.]|nr:insulinase family protein [Sphingopyxis sp.]
MKASCSRRLALLLSPFALLAVTAAPPPLWAQSAASAAPSKAHSAVNPQSAAADAWKFASSDLAADPAVTFGVLGNGMKYAILPNATPKGRVSIRMHVDVGSLAEADDQRGLAHFLEHMAFNGSKAIAEGDLIKLLERKGLAFGADTNASTGFDATEYKLDLPQGSDDLIDTALLIMRETASELTIAPDAVNRERGIILSERRARDTYALRNLVEQLRFQYQGLRLADRLPIGTEEVIRNAPASRIRDFYRAFYRPERITLVVVGDIDAKAIETKIQSRFADWSADGAAVEQPGIGALDFARPLDADIFVDPAISDSVSISYLRPYRKEADDIARRSRVVLENIGQNIISRRFSKIAASEDAPVLGGGLSRGNGWKAFHLTAMSATAREGDWAAALALAEQEMRRILEQDVTEAEVQEQLANHRTALRNAVANASTRRSEALAASLVAAVSDEFIFIHPEEQLKILEQLEPQINARTVTDALRSLMDGVGQPLIRVTAKKPIEGGKQAVLAAYQASQAQVIAASQAQAVAAFAYEDLGKPGRVVSDERVPDLDIRRIRFANNVMLNIKRTDFQKDRVAISMRVDGGALMATREDPTKVALAGSLAIGGLEAHSFDDLRSIFAGRTISPAFGMSADAFGGSATTTPQDLALQAKVMAAYLLHPGYRADGLAMMRRVYPQHYAAMDATPAAVIARDQEAIITGHDPRMVTPSLDQMMALDWASLKANIIDNLRRGALEIGIVGDIDEQAAIDAIAASFGALPKRRAQFDPRKQARDLRFTSDFSEHVLIHKGPADQADLRVYWPARDDEDLAEAMQLNLLSRVLGLKLLEEVREKLGESYSPQAGVTLSSIYPGFGRLSVASNVDVQQIDATLAVIFTIARELRDQEIDADLLERARKPLIETMVKSRRENSYWLGYVSAATSRGDRLSRIHQAIGEIERVSVADIQKLARRYLLDDKALVIKAISDKAVAGDQSGAGGGGTTEAPGIAP